MRTWLWRQALRGAELLHKIMWHLNLRPPVRVVAWTARQWGDSVDRHGAGRGDGR